MAVDAEHFLHGGGTTVKQIGSSAPYLAQRGGVPPFLKFYVLSYAVHLTVGIVGSTMAIAAFQLLKYLLPLASLGRQFPIDQIRAGHGLERLQIGINTNGVLL